MDSVTDATFDAEVLEREGAVVVDFWAPWCGPCKAIEPALNELAAEATHVRFVKVDIDENPQTAARFDVLSIPMVILFSGGEPQATVVGARPKKHFAKVFADVL